jgi:hypothetical protein
MRFLTFCGVSMALWLGFHLVPVRPDRFVVFGVLVLFLLCAVRSNPPPQGLSPRSVYTLTMGLGALMAAPGLCAAPIMRMVFGIDTSSDAPLEFYGLALILALVGWRIYRWADDQRRSVVAQPIVPSQGESSSGTYFYTRSEPSAPPTDVANEPPSADPGGSGSSCD